VVKPVTAKVLEGKVSRSVQTFKLWLDALLAFPKEGSRMFGKKKPPYQESHRGGYVHEGNIKFTDGLH
jgi:hypothetical protein